MREFLNRLDFYDTDLFVGADPGVCPNSGEPNSRGRTHGCAPTLDTDERYRINVFDWNAEFPAIMKAGGFDAVIGNPPYIRMERVDYRNKGYRMAEKEECNKNNNSNPKQLFPDQKTPGKHAYPDEGRDKQNHFTALLSS